MAGIYIHIPFCRKACHYCNFHFSTSFKKKDELVDAIAAEIKLQSNYLEDLPVGTVYFGGGTPSALPPEDIARIYDAVMQYHPIEPQPEVTLEANPDDINENTLSDWKKTGINRLSIGIQAFQDELLQAWNRSHSGMQAADSLYLSKLAGFENISADLIYGGEGLSDEKWIHNIQVLLDAGVPHISSYALTVESGTVLAHQIKKGKAKSPDDDQGNRQYGILQNMLAAAGYEQYEVSNFCKPGYRSKHNTGYWSGAHYLGIGPSAHSYNGISRQWNVAHNIKYTHAISHNKVPFEVEILTDVQCYNELVMTGLRISDGIDMHRIRMLKKDFEQHLHTTIQPFVDEQKIYKKENGNYALRPAYYFFADGIAADLFILNTPSKKEPAKTDIF